MPAWNDKTTEREEASYLTTRAELRRALGEAKYEEFIDSLILRHASVLSAYGQPDNPAVIRLKELVSRRERGFE